MLDKLKAIFEEYGTIAIVCYFSIFGLVLVGFFLAFLWGASVSGVDRGVGTGGALVAGYIATKATQPLRIGATLLLTPVIGAVVKKKKKASSE